MSPTASRSVPRREAPDAPVSGAVRVGCSGWHYKGWRGRVYPAELPAREWLREYANRFNTVEINNSFYRLPPEDTFAWWRTQVPRGFLFAVKASRFLTHIKRLRDPEEPLARLLDRAKALGPTLGPLLYQLPPRWIPDRDRFRRFLEALPDRPSPRSRHRLRHVVEFRDPRGYEPWILDLLNTHGVALCVHDMPGSQTPLLVVGPIVYVRLHGYGAKYGGSYPDDVLTEWAEWIAQASRSRRDAHVYFNNDVDGFAVSDASRLRARVRQLIADDGGSSVASSRAGRSRR